MRVVLCVSTDVYYSILLQPSATATSLQTFTAAVCCSRLLQPLRYSRLLQPFAAAVYYSHFATAVYCSRLLQPLRYSRSLQPFHYSRLPQPFATAVYYRLGRFCILNDKRCYCRLLPFRLLLHPERLKLL